MVNTQLFKEIFKKLVNSGGFDRVLSQANIVSASNGNVIAELTICKEHTNRGGTLHGGLIATIVDQLSTMALLASQTDFNPNSVTVSQSGLSVCLNLDFLSSAKVGDCIVINASTLRKGSKMCFLNVDVFEKVSGRLVAKGSHVKFIPSST